MPTPSGPTASQRAHRQRPFPLDRLTLEDQTAHRLRFVARIWVTAAVVMFIALSLRPELLHHPDLPYWSGYAWDGLLYLMAVGALVSWRWEGAGATMLVIGAAAIGILAALEDGPMPAFGIALLFLIPGLLFWLLWQRDRPAWHGGALAAGLGLTVAVAGYYAVDAYRTSYGPLQPESTAVVQPAGMVDWIWSGGVTDTSAIVTAAMTENVPDVRLIVSTRDDLSAPLVIEPDAITTISGPDLRRFSVTGLSPNTNYWYAITADGVTDQARRGQFRTFPSGAATFTFAFGACAHTGSNAVVFDTIRSTDPLFFLSTGDLFYEDIAVNDPTLYREAFDRTLASPAQGTLYRSTPFIYMWDDHDYGPNDSDGTAPGQEAAQANYRAVVPHYPLPGGESDGPIYQAFTVGRVRFIMTDNYSWRTPEGAPDGPGKTMLGEEQKAWLKEELRAANGTFPVIVWVNTQPWISDDDEGWGAYPTERQEIADFIAENDIQGLSMLSGDAHMLAIDDGSNANYAAEGDASFPVFHAAALDRPGSTKGGPYSEGFHPGPGHFGLVTIQDDGGSLIEVIWSGRNHEGHEVIGYRFTVDAEPQARPASAIGNHRLSFGISPPWQLHLVMETIRASRNVDHIRYIRRARVCRRTRKDHRRVSGPAIRGLVTRAHSGRVGRGKWVRPRPVRCPAGGDRR